MSSIERGISMYSFWLLTGIGVIIKLKNILIFSTILDRLFKELIENYIYDKIRVNKIKGPDESLNSKIRHPDTF